MPEAPALELLGLRHAYGEISVLSGVDLAVGKGELVALLGPSGCGKTTILRSIAGLLVPHGGEIHVGGTRVTADGVELVPAEQRRVGLVFQEYALFPHMSVRDNIAFGATGSDVDARVEELLRLTDLSGQADRRPAALSGGQQQRAALARALAAKPTVLLLDEPFANVDAGLRRSLGAGLRRIIADARVPALLVTHDRDDALGLADRVAVLESGPDGAGIVQFDTPQALYQHPATASVARLSGPAALLAATASGQSATTPLGTVLLRSPAEGPVLLVVRPHQARFGPGDGPATVVERRFEGPHWRIDVQTPAGPLTATWPQARPPAVGTSGTLHLEGPLHAVAGGIG